MKDLFAPMKVEGGGEADGGVLSGHGKPCPYNICIYSAVYHFLL